MEFYFNKKAQTVGNENAENSPMELHKKKTILCVM
jgi:hypothetical protein